VSEVAVVAAGGAELFAALGSLFRGAEEERVGSAGEGDGLGAAEGGAELFESALGAFSLDDGDGPLGAVGAACFSKPDEGVRERDGMRLGRKE